MSLNLGGCPLGVGCECNCGIACSPGCRIPTLREVFDALATHRHCTTSGKPWPRSQHASPTRSLTLWMPSPTVFGAARRKSFARRSNAALRIWMICPDQSEDFGIPRIQFLIGIRSGTACHLRTWGSASRLPKADRERAVNAIGPRAANSFPGTALRGNLRILWRLRMGADRALHELRIDALVVPVFRESRRRNAHRG